MERCPSCRARWDGNATCRRCGMDLDALLAVERAAERFTLNGVTHLAADRPAAAGQDLSRALSLHRSPIAALLLGFARMLEAERAAHVLKCTDSIEPPNSGNLISGNLR